jgi:hypothetical protein
MWSPQPQSQNRENDESWLYLIIVYILPLADNIIIAKGCIGFISP